MLGLQLKLTPAQVRVLLMLKHLPRPDIVLSNGRRVRGLPIELGDYPHYLNTTAALARRGLLIWETDGYGMNPSLTEEGMAVASLVYQSAKAITDLVENSAEKAKVDNETDLLTA